MQVIGTTLSVDGVHRHDMLAINGASAALDDLAAALPRADRRGARSAGSTGELVVNPSMPDMEYSTLDLIVCGTADAITMVEAGARW